MPEPSLGSISKLAAELGEFTESLAKQIKAKSWIKLALLFDATLLVALNPPLFKAGWSTVIGTPPTFLDVYWLSWGVAVAVVFIAALVGVVRDREPSPQPPPPPLGGALKGLQPFSVGDAEVFGQLQRSHLVREWAQAVTADVFRFGVICGPSGSGKSSFLQAGLQPVLDAARWKSVYVKYGDSHVLDALRLSVSQEFALPIETLRDATVTELFQTCSKAALERGLKGAVIIIDQFEQFFVTNRRRKHRAPFIAGLADWYVNRMKWQTKLLLCIRGDFGDRLIEFQEVMRYSLGPQEVSRIDNLEPRDAVAIFKVIAEHERLECDYDFLSQFVEDELADKDDGLVSPVDIQVLSLMIAAQRWVQGNGFNRRSFRLVGGIEGLLEQFLDRAISARETSHARDAAVKVLLALIEPDGMTRCPPMTLQEIQHQTQGVLRREVVDDAVRWLASQMVRLVTPVSTEDVDRFELAHERLIPAVRKRAGKDVTRAEEAALLLKRRVNEWLANERAGRYLLASSELRLIKRERAFRFIDTLKAETELFIRRSLRRARIRLGLSFTAALLPCVAAAWWISSSGQSWLMRRELSTLSRGDLDEHEMLLSIGGLAASGDSASARRLWVNMSPNEDKLIAGGYLVMKTGDPSLLPAVISKLSPRSCGEVMRETTYVRKMLVAIDHHLVPSAVWSTLENVVVETCKNTPDTIRALSDLALARDEPSDWNRLLSQIRPLPDLVTKAECIAVVARAKNDSSLMAEAYAVATATESGLEKLKAVIAVGLENRKSQQKTRLSLRVQPFAAYFNEIRNHGERAQLLSKAALIDGDPGFIIAALDAIDAMPARPPESGQPLPGSEWFDKTFLYDAAKQVPRLWANERALNRLANSGDVGRIQILCALSEAQLAIEPLLDAATALGAVENRDDRTQLLLRITEAAMILGKAGRDLTALTQRSAGADDGSFASKLLIAAIGNDLAALDKAATIAVELSRAEGVLPERYPFTFIEGPKAAATRPAWASTAVGPLQEVIRVACYLAERRRNSMPLRRLSVPLERAIEIGNESVLHPMILSAVKTGELNYARELCEYASRNSEKATFLADALLTLYKWDGYFDSTTGRDELGTIF